MKNSKQYKDSGTLPKPPALDKKSPTKSVADIKLVRLEEAIASQDAIIAKLKRDIARLKDQIGEIVRVLNNRG